MERSKGDYARTDILGNIARLRGDRCRQISSFDKSGGNRDFVTIDAGETYTLMEVRGAGTISRFWLTIGSSDRYILRNALLKIYWDDESNPSVESPIGDFFGVGFAEYVHYTSMLLGMSSGGYYSYFPMPYEKGCRVVLVNESTRKIDGLYYAIAYQSVEQLGEEIGRFHAKWKRENPVTRDLNYTILDAEGKGHYVGCNLSMQSYKRKDVSFLEGDEMIYVDGELFPSIHGTGTEDYFNCGWYFNRGAFDGPFHGVTIRDLENSRISAYRLHILDPIPFESKIRVTIEHGHASLEEHDYSSVAYWYQEEPHKEFFKMPTAEGRIPAGTNDLYSKLFSLYLPFVFGPGEDRVRQAVPKYFEDNEIKRAIQTERECSPEPSSYPATEEILLIKERLSAIEGFLKIRYNLDVDKILNGKEKMRQNRIKRLRKLVQRKLTRMLEGQEPLVGS